MQLIVKDALQEPVNSGQAERQAQVSGALASVRLEGLEPTDAAKAVFERYISGEISLEEMGAAIDAVNTREFGPLHIPGE